MRSPLPSPDARQLLFALLRPQRGTEPWHALSFDSWMALLRLAGQTWLIGALQWRLRALGLTEAAPPEILDYIGAAAQLARARAQDQVRQALEIARVLNSAGLEPVFLKGAAAQLTGLYPDPGARLSGDIDLLVAPSQLALATATLAAHGYAEASGKVTEGDSGQGKHAPRLFRADQRFGVEIHRAIISGRQAGTLTALEILASAEAIECDGVCCRAPRVDHRIMHCIIHLMGDYRLGAPVSVRQLLELRLLVEQAGPNLDWRAINQRFARSRRSADLGFCLLQAQRLVGLSPRQAPISFRARLWARLDHHGALPTPHFRLAFAYGFGLLGRATAAGLQHAWRKIANARNPPAEAAGIVLRNIRNVRRNSGRVMLSKTRTSQSPSYPQNE